MTTKSDTIGLYIHIPWCVRKCPYCDFNSHALRGEINEQAYIDALRVDLLDELNALPQWIDSSIDSIFFGGGTPSLFSAQSIGQILGLVREHLQISEDAEITLEANPGASEQARFAGYRATGVNRLSIGIQSLDDAQLIKLGRVHDATEAKQSIVMAKQAGFDNFNVDMMFALSGQTLRAAADDLSALIDLGSTHLSYYQLTLEPNTLFHAKPPSLPDEDLAADMQQQGIEMLVNAGFAQYEVSAYAKSGLRSRHNMHYWQFDDYIGIGAGAHGKFTDVETGKIQRRWKHKQPAFYQQALLSHQSALGAEENIAPQRQLFEFMLNRLRLYESISWQELTDKIPSWNAQVSSQIPDAKLSIFKDLETQNLIKISGNGFSLTKQGHLFLNQVLLKFLPSE